MNRFINWKGHAWLALPMRLYLGGIFLLACYHKILYPELFAIDVATYQILPTELINLTAVILPWIELFAGLLLVVGFRTRGAVLLINGMMVVFIVAVTTEAVRLCVIPIWARLFDHFNFLWLRITMCASICSMGSIATPTTISRAVPPK